MNNIKIGILLVFIFIVAVGGFYLFYISQVQNSQNLTPPPISSPKSSFPTSSPSASPVAQTQPASQTITQPGQVAGVKFPSTQPETGEGQTQAQNVGIIVNTPQKNTKISSPVTVSGTANVPNNIIVEVKDANGQILGIRKTTACFGYNSCPFTTSIVFDNSQTANGTITAYSPSLTDGTPEYSETVTVSF